MPSRLHASSPLNTTDDKPTRLSRSPQPYHRWSEQQQASQTANEHGYLPSPAPTPATSDTEDDTTSRSSRLKSSPDESSTEFEDEGVNLTRALPAPQIKPRKGLRNAIGLAGEGELTPLLTPSVLHEEGRRLSSSYFDSRNGTSPTLEGDDQAKQVQALQKFHRRRRAELIRRASELLSLCSIAYAVLSGQTTSYGISGWTSILLCYLGCVCFPLLIFPIRLLLHPLTSDFSLRVGSLGIPATFDPAPILYPPFLPVLVALSLSRAFPQSVLPNLVLGLSALPADLFPLAGCVGPYNPLHWITTCIPYWLFSLTPVPSRYQFEARNTMQMDVELLTLLFPLHQAVLRPLHYLTTTSLLPAELQLLSVSLINLLLLSESAQTAILRNLLWIGGLGMFFLCTHVLQWNIELERIPSWRFRRAGRVMASARTFIKSLSEGINHHDGDSLSLPHEADKSKRSRNIESSTTKDKLNGDVRVSRSAPRARAGGSRRQRSISDVTNLNMPNMVVSNNHDEEGSSIKRTRTLPKAPGISPARRRTSSRRRRSPSQSAQPYLAMTPKQVLKRKWGYAIYTYTVVVFLILIPIRITIGSQALNGNEPFGWALGYLFSDLPGLGPISKSLGVDAWIALPSTDYIYSDKPTGGIAEVYRQAFGYSTTRIYLFAYWVVVIALGLVTVLFGLRGTVEVDTRRKVFHGMMVVMLLPSTYVDPCFLALGLTLVLAVFLLLDLFRAAQLRPLSKPLATFLAPYVDGRDLRGPVVVSHIFLLIGCAIPLWLSLAGTERRLAPASEPWKGWELETRDVSMVAGVVCVGMGDAAASLIGRRYGRRKWPWAGGKSLEGSAAFAVAVTVGLMAGRIWMHVGGWRRTLEDGTAWSTIAAKAMVAASGASFTEAVLTGANDNVVVPVVLWLLVRGLGV